MNVADFTIKFLSERGVDTVFMVTGGQAMYLNDAVYRDRKIKPVFCHHEQTAAMAAEAYGRTSGKLGVVMVTAGPGAVNALNGVVGAYCDSAPMMVVSGQSSSGNLSYMQKTKIRQYGLQGINIAPMASSCTKYFKSVDDPPKILNILQEAYFQATNGRFGPVWIEIPLDISRMEVPKKLIFDFTHPEMDASQTLEKKDVLEVLDMIYESKRPLFLAGQGVRLSSGLDEFNEVISKLKMPVVTTRLGIDLIESDNSLFVGRPGLYADRAANFAIQNADLILSVGARLDAGIVGYDVRDWGRLAKKVVVDIDNEELSKPGIKIDVKIKSDAREFLREVLALIDTKRVPDFSRFREVCVQWKDKYPTVLPKYRLQKPVNSYYFSERLSELAEDSDTIVVDTSSPFHVVCQSWKIKKGQRFLTTGGISTMGYWPAAIGACLANGKKRTIVVTGDGCLQMNIQELATVYQNKLPLKIFVINNNGYLLIRHTQKTHLEGRLMGESPKTGLFCPDLAQVAKTYKIKSVKIDKVAGMDKKILEVLKSDAPVLCEVVSPQWQLVVPRVSSKRKPDGSFETRPYEDLFPFLPKEELRQSVNIALEDK